MPNIPCYGFNFSLLVLQNKKNVSPPAISDSRNSNNNKNSIKVNVSNSSSNSGKKNKSKNDITVIRNKMK